MDKQIFNKLAEFIDSRIASVFKQQRNLMESPATVISANDSTGKATVQFINDDNVQLTLFNKTGEALSTGETVFINWRGILASNTGYVARRSGATVSKNDAAVIRLQEDVVEINNEKGADNGIATLNSAGQLECSQIPDSINEESRKLKLAILSRDVRGMESFTIAELQDFTIAELEGRY